MTYCILTSLDTGKKYYFQSARTASTFLGYTKTYMSNAIVRGISLKHKTTGERFNLEYKKVVVGSQSVGNNGKPHVQPCTTCKNFAGGCEWSERFEPVEGWVAEPTIIGRYSYTIDSYRIISCPKYERG